MRRLNEDSYWSPLPRIYDIKRVSLAGTVDGLRGLRPGKNIRVKPYALGSSNTVGRIGTDGDFDAGFDVKYGVTSGLTWDFTVNTDFSQVEADEQQINLSRFNLFFPEKRDFFLENSGIFQFGAGGGGFAAVAAAAVAAAAAGRTRRRTCGCSSAGGSACRTAASAIPILAGTRLTGRQGAYSMGVLNIQQREQGAVPATNFTAAARAARHPRQLRHRRRPPEQGGDGPALQPRRRRRRELPVRLVRVAERLRREDVLARPPRSSGRRGNDTARARAAATTDRDVAVQRALRHASARGSTTRWASSPRQGVDNAYVVRRPPVPAGGALAVGS